MYIIGFFMQLTASLHAGCMQVMQVAFNLSKLNASDASCVQVRATRLQVHRSLQAIARVVKNSAMDWHARS